MDHNLFVQKREFAALQRAASQNKASLDASVHNVRKLNKKLALYANQHRVILGELNVKLQQLSREKMMAEGVRDMIRKEKALAQIELLNQIRTMVIQKIGICN